MQMHKQRMWRLEAHCVRCNCEGCSNSKRGSSKDSICRSIATSTAIIGVLALSSCSDIKHMRLIQQSFSSSMAMAAEPNLS